MKAALAIVAMKVLMSRSYRAAPRRETLKRWNMRSTGLRCLYIRSCPGLAGRIRRHDRAPLDQPGAQGVAVAAP